MEHCRKLWEHVSGAENFLGHEENIETMGMGIEMDFRPCVVCTSLEISQSLETEEKVEI